MQFSLRSLFLFTVGVAAVASAASTFGPMAGLIAMVLFISAVGAYSNRDRYWWSCFFAGLGGTVALWLGLIVNAFVLPWILSQGGSVEGSSEAYKQFVRETFLMHLLFLAVEGFIIGVIVATLVWAIRRAMVRSDKLETSDTPQ